MTGPNLLLPAIIAFALMILGVVLTIREYYAERGRKGDPVNHIPEIVKPSPDQVRPTK